MTTLLAFLVALAILIAVHEYGHYRVARACGVKVLRFSLGFGRVLLRWQKNPQSTEFTLSAIPLGGYVRMLDERDPSSGPVAPEERAQAFNNRPLLQRVAVVAAGPIANLLLAVLLLSMTAWLGSQEPRALLGTPIAGSLAERAGLRAGDLIRATSRDGAEWEDVRSLLQAQSRLLEAALEGAPLVFDVTDAAGHGSRQLRLDTASFAGVELNEATQRQLLLAGFAEPVLGEVKPEGAGAQAGLLTGDRVLAIDGVSQPDAAAVRDRIRAAVAGGQGRVMHWQIERGGQPRELDVQPRVVDQGGTAIGRIEVGIGAPPALVEVRYGFVEGLQFGLHRTWEMSTLTLRLIKRMLVGEASVKNLSGPLAMADYAGQAARAGFVVYLGYLAMISVSLGVLNLLPLPMLDGGHLMYYLFEGLSGRPVSEWWQQQLQRVGVLVLLLMMGLALSNDVSRMFLR